MESNSRDGFDASSWVPIMRALFASLALLGAIITTVGYAYHRNDTQYIQHHFAYAYCVRIQIMRSLN